MSNATFPLADVLKTLRTEIAQAIRDGEDESVRFQIGPVEVELVGVIEKAGGGNAKAEFKVLGIGAGIGADAKVSRENTQRIKVTLQPKVRKDGGDPPAGLDVSEEPGELWEDPVAEPPMDG